MDGFGGANGFGEELLVPDVHAVKVSDAESAAFCFGREFFKRVYDLHVTPLKN